jgi:hypothetical protein
LNLILTAVLVEYLIRTDPLALALSVAWILLGGITYFALDRLKTPPERDSSSSSTEMTMETED